MDTINRSEAQAQGLRTYYTGERCRNGHLTYRYTQSGTCCLCIREHAAGASIPPPPVPPVPPAALAAITAQREQDARRRVALGMLAEIKLWAHESSIHDLRLTAIACCIGTYPCLAVDDVKVTYGPTATAGELGHYRVRVPDEYVVFMRELADTYEANRTQTSGAKDLAKSREMINEILRSLGQSVV